MQGLRTCASRTTPHQLNTRIFRNTKNSNMKTEIKTIQQFDLIFLFAPFHRTQVQVGSNHCNWVAMSLCHSVRELWLKLCECWPYYLMILVEEHIWWPMTVLWSRPPPFLSPVPNHPTKNKKMLFHPDLLHMICWRKKKNRAVISNELNSFSGNAGWEGQCCAQATTTLSC